MIEVKQTGAGDPMTFDVRIREGGGETRHAVTLSRGDAERLCAGAAPADCVAAAVRFLLDREPKEAILARFDLTVIGRYFPGFEAALPDYLSRGAGR
jgi:hypothetical protein